MQRLKSIESVIDNHLKLLLYKEGARRNTLYDKYSKYSYFKKMMMLMHSRVHCSSGCPDLRALTIGRLTSSTFTAGNSGM